VHRTLIIFAKITTCIFTTVIELRFALHDLACVTLHIDHGFNCLLYIIVGMHVKLNDNVEPYIRNHPSLILTNRIYAPHDGHLLLQTP
jgi:hypothetical protein